MATADSLHRPQPVNPNTPVACRSCNGQGLVQHDDGDPLPCDHCDGLGHLRLVEMDDPAPPAAPAPAPCVRRSYLAASGAKLIDRSNDLDHFLKEMADGWEHGDLGIWEVSDGADPQLVAVIRPGPGGDGVIRRL